MTNQDQPRADNDNSVEAPWALPYMQGYSVPVDMATLRMTPTYEDAVCREMEGLYGTPNRDSAAAPVPANYVTHGWTANHDTITAPVPSVTYSPTQMGEGHPLITTTENTRSCLVVGRCQWTGVGVSEPCDVPITYQNVPAHFRDTHGIKRMNEDVLISCWWGECRKRVIRKNFVRHIRECHLDHCRKKRHPS
ncbi:hypothetical protein HD554DRAFT_2152209 [Boletus coccyginus]|nr:hypothetical protein HD554DRAFT_2152209 [Boletus coccyginus]